MVTIVDVARMAGVSTATVSHAFSAKRPVSQETRTRVLAVATRAGYRPNHVAASMVTGRTRTIGMIVPDIGNPFFSEMVRGAEAAAMAAGYMTIVCSSELDAALEDRCVEVLADKRVDALLYLPGTSRPDNRLGDPALARTPLVVIDEELDGLPPGASVVTSDNEAGGALVAHHLCDLGHREIGVLAGPAGLPTAEARLRGFAAVLRSRGISLPAGRIVRAGYYTRDAGLVMGRELLTSHPEITAVYCGNDLIALGVLTAAAACGRPVGRDLSVTGFDDIFVSQLVNPALTTVRQPIARLGSEATQLAVRAMQECGGGPRRMVLPVELVVRGSTAPVSGWPATGLGTHGRPAALQRATRTGSVTVTSEGGIR